MGLRLAGIYAFLTAIPIIAAFGDGDPKGDFVLLQLPLALQIELIPRSVLEQIPPSWPMAYLLLWTPVALVLYAIGALIDYRLDQSSGFT